MAGIKDRYASPIDGRGSTRMADGGVSTFKSIVRRGDSNPQRAWGTPDRPEANAPAGGRGGGGALGRGSSRPISGRGGGGALGRGLPRDLGDSDGPPKSDSPAAKTGRRRDQEPPEAHRPLTPKQAQLRGEAMVTRAKASARSKAPADTASPAAKASWWDKFSGDHKLSADKSYSDYKKLMGD